MLQHHASGSKMCKFNPNLNFFFTLFVWNLEGGSLICIDVMVICCRGYRLPCCKIAREIPCS
jgi:hypothetical protein